MALSKVSRLQLGSRSSTPGSHASQTRHRAVELGARFFMRNRRPVRDLHKGTDGDGRRPSLPRQRIASQQFVRHYPLLPQLRVRIVPVLGGYPAVKTLVYAGHDTSSGVKVSNEPVRRNQIVEDKFAPAREWMKEVQDETRRTRTGNGYKAYLRASRQYTTKPQT